MIRSGGGASELTVSVSLSPTSDDHISSPTAVPFLCSASSNISSTLIAYRPALVLK